MLVRLVFLVLIISSLQYQYMSKETILIIVMAVIMGFGVGYISRPSKDRMVDKTNQSAPHYMSSSTMTQTMTGMTEHLKGKTGEDLEKAFLEEMIVHHEGAVAMAKELQGGTTRPELIKMANDIINVQTTEINMMKGWLSEWFGK